MKKLLCVLFLCLLPLSAGWAASDAEAAIIRILSDIDGKTGTATVTVGGGTFTPSISTVSSSGTVAAGKHYIEFVLSSDFAGTIGGVTYSGASTYSKAIGPIELNTFAALSYTITAGSAILTTY